MSVLLSLWDSNTLCRSVIKWTAWLALCLLLPDRPTTNTFLDHLLVWMKAKTSQVSQGSCLGLWSLTRQWYQWCDVTIKLILQVSVFAKRIKFWLHVGLSLRLWYRCGFRLLEFCRLSKLRACVVCACMCVCSLKISVLSHIISGRKTDVRFPFRVGGGVKI